MCSRTWPAAQFRPLSNLYPGAEYVTDKRPDNFLNIGSQDAVSGTPHRAVATLEIRWTTVSRSTSCTSRPRHELRSRSARHRPLLPGIPPADGSLAGAHGPDIFDFDYDAYVCATPAPPSSGCLRSAAWSRMRTPEGSGACGAVKTASVWQVREPLHRRSSGRWRNYARQLAALEADLRRYGCGRALKPEALISPTAGGSSPIPVSSQRMSSTGITPAPLTSSNQRESVRRVAELVRAILHQLARAGTCRSRSSCRTPAGAGRAAARSPTRSSSGRIQPRGVHFDLQVLRLLEREHRWPAHRVKRVRAPRVARA